MNRFVNPYPIAVALLFAAGLCLPAGGDEAPPIRLAIELKDGTRLVGTANLAALNLITASDETIEMPLSRIRSIEFGGEDRKRAEILLEDGITTLYGTLELRAVELATSLGTIAVPTDRIARISKAQVAGLVGYYPFNGNVKDESGNANDGTVHGAVLTVDRFGNADAAYYFRGREDYIDCGTGESLQLGGSGRSWTVAFWIWRTEAGANQHVIGMGSPQANCAVNIAPTLEGGFAVDFGQNRLVTPDPYPDVKEWHHWAVTYDGGTNARKIYRDGIVVGEDVSPEDYLGRGSVYIGQRVGESSWQLLPFHGAIDEVRFYNRALSESEVQELRTLDGPAPGAGETYKDPGTISVLDGRRFARLFDRVPAEIRSERCTHKAEPDFAEFTVEDPNRMMKWILPLNPPIDTMQWEALDFAYRAKGLFNDGTGYVLFLSDGREIHHSGGFETVLPIEIIPDGKLHNIHVKLGRFNPAGPIRDVIVCVRSGKEGNAMLRIEKLSFRLSYIRRTPTHDALSPQAAARRAVPEIERQALMAPAPTLSLLDGVDFAAVPQWVHQQVRSEQYGHASDAGFALFAVDDPNRRMKWRRSLDRPIDTTKWPLLEFQYRATGLYNDGEEFVLFLFDGRVHHYTSGFVAILPIEMIPDGKPHTIVVPLARFNPAGPISSVLVRVHSGEEGKAVLRVEKLQFIGPPRHPVERGDNPVPGRE